MPSAISTSFTPAKLALSNSLLPTLLSKTLNVISCPPEHDGSMAPKQAVSVTATAPVPVQVAPAMERLRSVIDDVLLAVYWMTEVCSKMPEAVDANQPPVYWKPGLPAVVMGVTAMLPAGSPKPGGFEVPEY